MRSAESAQPGERLTHSAWSRRHHLGTAAVGGLLGSVRLAGPLDSDVFWSTRFGLEVLGGRFPRQDSYSWTAEGTDWVANSWGWNLLLGFGYRIGDEWSYAVLAVAVGASLGLLVGSEARRAGASPSATVGVLLALGGLSLVVVPRAQAVSCLVPLLMLPLVRRMVHATGRDFIISAIGIVGIQWVWMNLHSGALIGPLLVVAGCSLSAFAVRGSTDTAWVRRTAVVGLLCAAVCLATPYGLRLVFHATRVRNEAAGVINEWDRPGFGSTAQIATLLLIALAVLTARIAWQQQDGASAGMIIVLALASASAVRFGPQLCALMIPVLAAAISRTDVRPQFIGRLAWLAAAAVGVASVVAVARFPQRFSEDSAQTLVAAIPPGCHLLNDYAIGGAVILLRPDVRVSIDGRIDMYGKDLVAVNTNRLRGGPGSAQEVIALGVHCVLARSNSGLIARLQSEPSWRLIGTSGQRSLLVTEDVPGG